jgi:hypothetical protein
VEIGVLLPQSLNNLEAWHTFLERMNVTGAELLPFESQGNSLARGGSAAGNLVWLLQGIVNTYSRTSELVKVCHLSLPIDAFRMLLPLTLSLWLLDI